MNNKLMTAKKLTFIGAIFAIVIGAFWCLTLIGIIWGLPTLIGGILLLKYHTISDELFLEKRTPILVWGIILLFTTTVGGILLLVAYSTTGSIQLESVQEDSLMSLEKAFELKEKGALTDEEFQKIKDQSLN